MIYDTKVCDRFSRNTHHVDYPCCKTCSGLVACRGCEEKARRAPPALDSRGRPTLRAPRVNYHHRRFPCCRECAEAKKH